MKYDLAIAHRVCPILAKTADRFSDKYMMVEATTASSANGFVGFKDELDVILDECPPEYELLFNKTFGSGELESVVHQPIKKLPFDFHRAETDVGFLGRGWIE